MNRKKFLKNALITGISGSFAPQLFAAAKDKSAAIKNALNERVGFNHLPNKEYKNNEYSYTQSRQ